MIDSLVASGRYQNASEVLREGLRLLEQREAQEAAKLQALRAAAEQGFGDIDAGRYRDIADDELGRFVTALGQRAHSRLKAERHRPASSGEP